MKWLEQTAHHADHIGPMGWMFAGAGFANLLGYQNWLVGGLLIAMPILASVVAHEEQCRDSSA